MKSLDRLQRALRRLPGVGPRQAERFAAYLLRAPQGEVEEFVGAVLDMKKDVKLCRICHAYSESEICQICTDPDAEGETTVLYLADLLHGLVERVSRIGYGVPLGGDIDYIDELTLGYSLKGRTKI